MTCRGKGARKRLLVAGGEGMPLAAFMVSNHLQVKRAICEQVRSPYAPSCGRRFRKTVVGNGGGAGGGRLLVDGPSHPGDPLVS